jgi:uncharacterized membrane protein
MHKGRLEAFSDGVIAIIITIMVLELKVPHGGELEDLRPLLPTFVSYVLSFVYIGIYWNNHHHMLQAAQKVSGGILWANNHLLFWLSLIPFSTAWVGEHEFSRWPVALYGLNLLMCAIAYTILSRALIKHHGANSVLAKATGGDVKGRLSLVFYVAGIALTFVHPWLSYGCFIGVAVMWLIPDRRIETRLA